MTTISASASFQVPGGPTLALTSAIAAEAYDRIEVTVNPGDTDKEVEIQPGAAAQVRLLVVKSSLYGDEITYKVGDGSADSSAVTLDGPQIFIGPGVISLFGVDPKVLKFGNTHTDQAKKAQIEILVGRDATP
jgi:hypothetical protein